MANRAVRCDPPGFTTFVQRGLCWFWAAGAFGGLQWVTGAARRSGRWQRCVAAQC
jgi:hypothetical protein